MKSWPRTPLSLCQNKKDLFDPKDLAFIKKRISSNLVGKKTSSWHLHKTWHLHPAPSTWPIPRNPQIYSACYHPSHLHHVALSFSAGPVHPDGTVAGLVKPRLEVKITWENLTRRYKKIEPPTWITKYIQPFTDWKKVFPPHLFSHFTYTI